MRTCSRARGRRRQSGSALLYAVVLSPMLMLSLALATELGSLQLQKQRLRSAVDESAVVAAGRISAGGDATAFDAEHATTLLRASLADNLRALQGHIDGLSAEQVAANADIAVITDVPTADPFDASAIITRPTIEARVHVPLRTGLLSLAGLPATVTLTLISSADLRRTGAS